MSDNKLQVILSKHGITKNKASELTKAFGGPFEEAGKILANYKEIKVTDEKQIELMAKARKKRLALKKVRTTVENKRKELKGDIIKQGRAIDSVAKVVKEIIEPAEKYLDTQEKFAEIKAAERAAKLKAERTEQLMEYVDDISVYNLDDMTDEQFAELIDKLDATRKVEVAEAKRVEDERIAKEKADEEEAERIRVENERLRAEAEKKEAEREKERRIEADKLAKIEAENEKKLEAEREKREALEAKQAAEAEKKAKEKAEAEEEERKALLAPDKVKLTKFAEALNTIRAEKLPAVKTKQAQDVVNRIENELARLSSAIINEAREL